MITTMTIMYCSIVTTVNTEILNAFHLSVIADSIKYQLYMKSLFIQIILDINFIIIEDQDLCGEGVVYKQ